MLKRICLILCFVLLIPNVVYANQVTVSASSSVAIDSLSKEILYENNAKSVHSMASTTKIMTCIIACESDRIDDVVTITAEMLDGAIGSLIYLAVGDTITLGDLIKGAMLASGNDAANAIAVYLGGSISGFVSTMNTKAKDIGMINTNFVTPSGLDEKDHHSTAYDMALLASYALENNTFKNICSLKSCEICVNNIKQTIYNHNKLLSYDDNYIGVKTGYTDSSGRCLVSAYKYNDNVIIVVTFNAPDDWNDHKKIIDYVKSKYNHYIENYEININVVGSSLTMVKCKADIDLYCLSKIDYSAYFYPFLYAPIKQGDIVGKLDIICNDKVIMTVDIIAKEDVELWQEKMM